MAIGTYNCDVETYRNIGKFNLFVDIHQSLNCHRQLGQPGNRSGCLGFKGPLEKWNERSKIRIMPYSIGQNC